MVLIPVLCPRCHIDQVIKGGKTKSGQQRYKCQNAGCPQYWGVFAQRPKKVHSSRP